jgi:hypothetical protein
VLGASAAVAGAGGVVTTGVGGAVGTGCGAVAQPARAPRIAAAAEARAESGQADRGIAMWLLLLEALAALGLLVFIVWWVMFAGRRKGERRDREP